jgi:hypothetical protein
MTRIIGAKSTRQPADPIAVVVFALLFAFGTFIGSVQAQPNRGDHRAWDHRGEAGRGGGGRYSAPPVVYGGPVYYPPPVVYGPVFGIVVPGLSIGIQ